MSVFNQSRSNIIRLIFAGMFLIIAAQLFHLQIISKQYKEAAQKNALFKKSIYPTRGIIYDRKGRAILNNTIFYDLVVTPSQVRNLDTAYFCQLMDMDTAEFRRRMNSPKIRNSLFRAVTFQDLLPADIYARMEENLWKFPGFDLQERPVRIYPYDAAAQVTGYVGEVDSAILRRSNNYYQLGDYVGRSGLEQYYEKVLMGQRGTEFWLKDNKNRLVARYQDKSLDTPAIAGKNLDTYLDIELQQLAERLLYGKTGAIVAIDPKTGGILAMASGPAYDPNSLTGPDKQANYARLVLDVSGPLLNRAIKGQYPPGSTYKPLGALIGLDEGVITPASGIDCRGFYYGCGEVRRCDETAPGHAANLRLAIAHSCNSFFYNTFRLELDNPEFHSPRIGLMKWKEYVNGFGLGHRLGVDLPSEDPGNIPDTSVYDRDYHHSWNSCTMVTMGIGQDKMQETPLQIANAMCIVANKGYYYTPHFVRNIEGSPEDDTLLSRFHIKHQAVSHISDEDYNVVQSGMQGVTEIGTGQVARIPGIDMCAKTGTAENKLRIDGRIIKLRNHSLFACFAPREDPKIAVAVIVENGGYGNAIAAPIASLLVEKYLNDSIATDRLALEDEVTNHNFMPKYLVRKQFEADSIRAAEWADESGDSTRLLKYQEPAYRRMVLDTSNDTRSPIWASFHRPAPYKSALAERLATIRAREAAQRQAPDSQAVHSDSAAGRQQPDTIVRRPRRPPARKDSAGAAAPAGPDIPKDSTK